MKNYLLIFLLFFPFFNGNCQEINYNLEFETKISPILLAEPGEFNSFTTPNVILNNSSSTLKLKKQNFKFLYSLRFNKSSEEKEVGFGINYCRLNKLGYFIKINDSTNYLITKPYYYHYFGGDFKIQKKKSFSHFSILRGFKFGFGYGFRNSKEIIVAKRIPFPNTPSYRYYEHLVGDSFSYHLNFHQHLFSLNTIYSFNFGVHLNKKLFIFSGIDFPLLRIFFYNGSLSTGIGLNTDSFFSSFKSFALNVNDPHSFNQNLAFSLKRSQSTSVNFGVKYFFK